MVLDDFSEDIQERFNQLAAAKLPKANSQYLVGMSMNGADKIKVWYNSKMFDASAISLNLVHNAMVKADLGANCSILVTDLPLTIRNDLKLSRHRAAYNLIEPLIVIILLSISYLTSFYIMFHITERVSKVKLLQMIYGLNKFTFWFSTMLFDFITYMVEATIVMVTLIAFQREGWLSRIELADVFVVLVAFGFSVLPFICVLSFLFRSPAVGFLSMIIISVFLSTIELCFIKLFVPQSLI